VILTFHQSPPKIFYFLEVEVSFCPRTEPKVTDDGLDCKRAFPLAHHIEHPIFFILSRLVWTIVRKLYNYSFNPMDLIANVPYSLVPCGWVGCDEMNKSKKKYFVLLGLLILTGLRMFPDLPNAWSWNNRSEGIQEPVAILAGFNNDNSLASSRVFHPPSVFVDDELGYCFVSTNIPSVILESAGPIIYP